MMEIRNVLYSMEDLETGQVVVVVRGPLERCEGGSNMWTGEIVEPRTREDTSWRGIVYKVLAVDLPFIALQRGDRTEPSPEMIDLRTGIQFKILTPEMAEVMLAKPGQRPKEEMRLPRVSYYYPKGQAEE
jgi:hypothetical protein